jgi:transposase InsO family protein
MEAVRLVKEHSWSTRQAARHFGFTHSAVVKWLRKAQFLPQNSQLIPTQSSRPDHHPHCLEPATVRRILELRKERNQCAEILHHRLLDEGTIVSLSSVKRVLKRSGCSRYSRWKKWHQYPPRPMPEKPGILVEIDTMFEGYPDDRLSVYALIDVCSRWAYAVAEERINSLASVRFVVSAQQKAPFKFLTLQSDHGSEFSKWFTKVIGCHGFSHRHSRVRRPTDNGHIERFIRTLQEECLNLIPRNQMSWKKNIPEYLHYYNTGRPHMSLDFKTPTEILKVVPSY